MNTSVASTDAAPEAATFSARLSTALIDACERGLLPDALVRAGMRSLMKQRLIDEGVDNAPLATERLAALVDELRQSPIAKETDAANEQHYEVPSAFFHLHLGPRLKYSCAWYETGTETLAQAEEAMFRLYADRAGLANGQRILDLGCGWGSMSLWMAERFPGAQIVGMSNSHGQREYIQARARERGLSNLTILTANVVEAEFPLQGVPADFDRVVSIEMFEHMKNYQSLFAKVASWMKPGAQALVHVFAHRTLAYHFEVKDKSDWMTKYFFTGGIMPSADLFLHFQDHLKVQRRWWVDGRHYEKTSNHWLAGMDAARAQIMPVFEQAYGKAEAARWFQRWRMFYMAVAELFGYDEGREWGVVHYLFEKR
jgi:cyclopropane-fatty-acyl-phospholipid synthase